MLRELNEKLRRKEEARIYHYVANTGHYPPRRETEEGSPASVGRQGACDQPAPVPGSAPAGWPGTAAAGPPHRGAQPPGQAPVYRPLAQPPGSRYGTPAPNNTNPL